MATITIDWGNKIIYVPKIFTTLVQSTPIEIRQLSINDFRLELKELEWTVEGMAHLRTHNHNTEVLLGGITYARVVEIINGYTVTFEDGAYAVNLIGANSNIGDVVNLNQVSVRSANAAGLISNQAIEFSSFNGGVTIDAVGGVNGTAFPRGTPQLPVNNVNDANLIADLRGFNIFYMKGNFTFDTGDDIIGHDIIGQSIQDSLLTFNAGADTVDAKIFNATIEGEFDNSITINGCRVETISFVRGSIINSILSGSINLANGSGQTNLIDCKDALATDGTFPTINFSGSNNSLAIRNYDGDLSIINKSGSEPIEINMSTGGHIKIASSVTGGNIRITGIAQVTDETISGATIDVSNVIFPDQLQLASFNGYVYINQSQGASGTRYPIGTLQNPSNNINDALAIANYRGLGTFLIDGVVVASNNDISGKIFVGENNLDSILYLSGSGNITTKTTFKNMIITGRLNGHVYGEACGLQALSNVGSTIFPTIFRDCIIRADSGEPAIKLNNTLSGQNIHFIECVSGVPGQENPTFDFNGSDSPVAFRKYGGGITLSNFNSGQDCSFEFTEGQITLDSSCTNGMARLGGIYKLTNNSTLTIEERNGSITDNINLSGATFSADTEIIAAAVWNKLIGDHETADTFGRLLNDLLIASGQAQHSLNINTELLKNKPNNP